MKPGTNPLLPPAVQNGRLWRSLDEWNNSPEFRAWLEREFQPGASEWSDAMGRRQFLSLMGASLALAGLTGCSPRSHEKIVPYVDQPEQIIPGKPLIYASAMPLNGYGRGILVETQMGRPVKIEGNPAHPDSLGATDAITQAAVLELWDPDRSQAPYLQGNISDWSDFEAELIAVLTKAAAVQGEGLAVLTEFSTSPTLRRQMAELLRKFPKAAWYQSPPGGTVQQPLTPDTDFGKYDLIVSVGSDFLIDQPASLRFTRQFAARRRVQGGKIAPNRLYVLESTPTLTGAMADHRLSAPPDRIAAVLRRIGGAPAEPLDAREETFASNLAADLAANADSALVITGEAEPAEIHDLAAALGKTPAPAPLAFPAGQLSQLARDLESGLVQQLFILGGNPVYTAPAGLHLGKRIAKATFAVHLSLMFDETSQSCRWHLPEAHFLEAWSDILASDGTPAIIQPAIDPLYGGRSIHEILFLLTGGIHASGYDIVRMTWEPGIKNDFDAFWQQSLHDGIVKAPSPIRNTAVANPPAPISQINLAADANYLLIRPDPTIGDGRWANNGWLQELPKPLTKLTWDNAALFGPAMAQRLGLKTGDMVELRVADRSVEAPVLILPGQSDRCVTVHLGYGRRSAGSVGTNRGFDAAQMQTVESPWITSGLAVRKTGARYSLACTQHHFNMEGRDIVRVANVNEFRAHPDFAASKLPAEPSLLPSTPPVGHASYAWGMSVDLSTCTGCNACVVACQSENNIPIVGKEEVMPLAARCTGFASTNISRVRPRIRLCCTNPSRACIARRPRVRSSAQSPPLCTTTKGSTRWCTIVASALVIARTIARTRSAVSIFSNTRRRPTPPRPNGRIRTSLCAAAGSWRNALTVSSGSMRSGSPSNSRTGKSAMAKS
jgi:MoCo/4Fe-4S cofactor protein with predicted Tat translocation signal